MPTKRQPSRTKHPPYRVVELAGLNNPVLRNIGNRWFGRDRPIEYHGVDIVPYYGRTNRIPSPKNVSAHFHEADAYGFIAQYRGRANVFDEIHFHMPDKNEPVSPKFAPLLKSIFRLLKPGGLFYSASEGNSEMGFTNRARVLDRYAIRPKVLEPAKHNQAIAKMVRAIGFEIVRADVGANDSGVGTPPVGIKPEKGKKFPRHNAAKFIDKVTDYGKVAGTFVVLRKPKTVRKKR